MPLFMDEHDLDGPVSAAEVAQTHAADLEHQDAHGLLADAIRPVVEGS